MNRIEEIDNEIQRLYEEKETISIYVDDSNSMIVYNPVDFTKEITQEEHNKRILDWIVSIGFDINKILFDRANENIMDIKKDLAEKEANLFYVKNYILLNKVLYR